MAEHAGRHCSLIVKFCHNVYNTRALEMFRFSGRFLPRSRHCASVLNSLHLSRRHQRLVTPNLRHLTGCLLNYII